MTVMGWKVWINGLEKFVSTPTRKEAEDYAWDCWVKARLIEP